MPKAKFNSDTKHGSESNLHVKNLYQQNCSPWLVEGPKYLRMMPYVLP